MSANIVMVIAHQGFRDEEYWEPKTAFEAQGFHVATASTSREDAVSKFGKSTPVDLLLRDVDADDFDAILFVGGPGCVGFFDDALAHQCIRAFQDAGKWVLAICSATVILARAGILKGRKATVFPDDADLIIQAGAEYTGALVEQDGRIITANGPAAAGAFARTIIAAMQTR